LRLAKKIGPILQVLIADPWVRKAEFGIMLLELEAWFGAVIQPLVSINYTSDFRGWWKEGSGSRR
jgi:hypothetical protein